MIQVNIPGSHFDFANSPKLQTSVTLDDKTDQLVSILLPLVFIILTLPTTITRMAMRGMNCVVVKVDAFEQLAEQNNLKLEIQRAREGVPLRLGVSLCFGVLGISLAAIMVLVTLLVYVNLFSN